MFSYEVHSENKIFGLAKCTRTLYFEILLKTLVVTNEGSNNIGILIGYGDGTFITPKMYSTGSLSSISLAIGDFNNDNLLDLTIVSNDTNIIGVLIGYLAVSFPNQMTYSTGSWPKSVAVGDFNNDTHLDIVVANEGTSNVFVFLGYIGLQFRKYMTLKNGNGSRPRTLTIDDVNNDDQEDMSSLIRVLTMWVFFSDMGMAILEIKRHMPLDLTGYLSLLMILTMTHD